MKNTLLFTSILSLIIFASSCNQCYDCTKKCGTCEKAGYPTLAGCSGDSILGNYSVETWKVYLESQGYTCAYNNDEMNDICGAENKKSMEENHYDCLKK